MKRVHEDSAPDVYGNRRPGPPPGLTSAHLQPPAIGAHSGTFPHPVLAPAPSQLPHPFDQIRDALPRPPFSTQHLSGSPQPNSPQVVGGSHLTMSQTQQPIPVHGQPAKTYQTHIQTPNPVHATAAGQQQYQRLKVEDALSYLDQVKLQFGNQPQVYNEFLDIMKEFKSQTIDTPGVISRVSALFKGHPDLIVGFNTFLPPGYKIEVSLTDINTVNVCAPTGTTTHLISGNGLIAAPPQIMNQNKVPPPPISSSGAPAPAANLPPTTAVAQSTAAPLPNTTSNIPQQKSPTRPLSLTSKSSPAPLAMNVAAALPLTSPGVQSQTQAQHHAINYVTKIKNRFQGQPEVYQKFLDILNNYQTEQKAIKENAVDQYGRPLQEQDVFVQEGKLATDVYQQVANLFNKQEDLLQEFSQFLPDATGSSFNPNMSATLVSTAAVTAYQPLSKKPAPASLLTSQPAKQTNTKSKKAAPSNNSKDSKDVKAEPMEVDSKEPVEKHVKRKHRSALKDVTLAEAVKHGNMSEFGFFEKVRKALKGQDVYENFLRCLVLFNNEVITRGELIQLATTFLGKFPDLFIWFKVFLGYKDNQQSENNITGFKDRGTGGELAHLEIDFASCKRSGASYRALPKSYAQPKCSGRTQLCKDLLNDLWVSLPSWSEDTQFPGTRKTQYEEYIYKCEDERFELDVVVETNLSTIKVLEGALKKMSRMSTEEQQKFKLDNCLGGTSEVIHKKAIYRIYGDKSPEVIDGLKKTPHVAIPLVLKRLKLKDEEWRHAQKQFNKVWRDQNEKYYLKSLDHQGINFKQNDLKAIRSKSLIREIEQLFEERSDQIEDGNSELAGPHINFTYQDQTSLEDASSLIIHHMKRQSSIHKEDKTKIKCILLQFLQDLFFAPHGDLSDDEQDESAEEGKTEEKLNLSTKVAKPDDYYNLIYLNNTWYTMLRMHQMLCERLLKMYQLAMKMASFEANDKKHRREGTAEALRLKKPETTDVEEFYPTFLDMVKNLLDGHLETNTYEDTLRETFGVNAYVAFTMDKLIQNIVRQLHNLVTDDATMKLIDIYKEESLNQATGGQSVNATLRVAQEMAYQKKVETLLVEENCFKIYFSKECGGCKMSMELLPTEDDQSEDHMEIERWAEYIDRYIGNTDIAPELKEHLCKKPIFLLRNARVLQHRAGLNEELKKENEDKEDNEEIHEEPYFPDLFINNNLECKVSMGSYKIRYVSGTTDFMYRKNALRKAITSFPNTNKKLHEIYATIHSSWIHENTTRDQCHQADDWLIGKASSEEMLPCTTSKDSYKYGGININKYSVVYNKDAKQTNTATSAKTNS